MSESSEEFRACAVCERSVLRGERVTEYVDGDGEKMGVCALCKPRAEASGWVPAAYAGTVDRPEPESRRARVGAALRERLARLEARPKPEPPQAPEPPPTPLEVFNSSREARKVAGLVRSLGEPRVSVRPRGAADAIIVVAWDLSWYRWEVSGERVTELAKGNEISELPAEDRDWNATVAEDGSINGG